MHKTRIYLPDGISEKVLTTLKQRAADGYGGYTMLEGTGGWKNDSGSLETESVNILEINGMKPATARATAAWVARKTDETEVMWETQQIKMGSERQEAADN